MADKDNLSKPADTKRMNSRRIIWGVILMVIGVIILMMWIYTAEAFGALTGGQFTAADLATFFATPNGNLVKTVLLMVSVLLFILAAYDIGTGIMGWGVVLPQNVTVVEWSRLWSKKGLESYDEMFAGKTVYTQCPSCKQEVQFVTKGSGEGRQFTCVKCNHVAGPSTS